MNTGINNLQICLSHHQFGRLQKAEKLYRRILQIYPDQPDALHLLGVIAIQVGKHDIVVDLTHFPRIKFSKISTFRN